MRWQLPELGATRIRRRFLWLPEVFGDEWRWLEFVTCEEHCLQYAWGTRKWYWVRDIL